VEIKKPGFNAVGLNNSTKGFPVHFSALKMIPLQQI
jgi:hypothetical protein